MRKAAIKVIRGTKTARRTLLRNALRNISSSAREMKFANPMTSIVVENPDQLVIA